ncbi:MAG: hypothetical protein JW731_12700 [Bacteroidales bacterium]|nr:hypothetical protein [Bacteroidales bacterium]
MIKNKISAYTVYLLLLATLMACCPGVNAQEETDCPDYKSNRTDKIFDKAVKAFNQYNFSESIGYLNDLIDIEPEYVGAWFLLGLIYIREGRMNLEAAKENLEQVIKLCPDFDIYAYYQ